MWTKIFWRRVLYKSCRFRFRSFSFLLTHCCLLPMWVEESDSARKLGHVSMLPMKSHWTVTINILANFFWITKSLNLLQNNLFRPSLNFSCLVATEQDAYGLRGQNQLAVPSGWGQARNPQKNPSSGRIELVTSAQKVTFETCPTHFLGKIISCPIYISNTSKKSIY